MLIGLAGLFLLTGCSKFKEKFGRLSGGSTSVRFGLEKNRGLSAMAALPGGVMVYAIDATGGAEDHGLAFSSEQLVNSSASLTLPNRPYRFYAFGYTGADLTGEVKCGFGNGGADVNLDGREITIQFNLSVANCAQPGFMADADFHHSTLGVTSLELVSCENSHDLSAVLDTDNCVSARGDMHNVRSMRVFVNTYDPQGTDHMSGLSSACIRGSGIQNFVSAQGDSSFVNSTRSVHVVSDGGILFGSSSLGIDYSDDDGTTYTNTPTASAEIRGFFESEDGTLYAATADAALGGGIYSSSDLGLNWAKLADVFTPPAPYPLPGYSGDYYSITGYEDKILAGGYQSLQFSDDAGLSWTSLDFTGTFDQITSVVVDPNGAPYYAAGYLSNETRLYESLDGITWTSLEHLPEAGTSDRVVYRRYDDGTHLLGSVDGLRISTDSGSSWTLFSNTLADWSNTSDSVQDAHMFDGTIYVGLGNGIAFTTDQGATWSSVLNDTNPVTGMFYHDYKLYVAHPQVNPSMLVSDNRGSGSVITGASMPQVPPGGGGDGFVDTSVQFYYDANCTIPNRSYEFPFGMAEASYPSYEAELRPSNPGVKMRLFMNDF